MSAISKCNCLFDARRIRVSASARRSRTARRRSSPSCSPCSPSPSQKSEGISESAESGLSRDISRARIKPPKSERSWVRSLPLPASACISEMLFAVFRLKMELARVAMVSEEVNPKIFCTFSSVIVSPQKATSWSSIDCASRMPPSAPLAMDQAAVSSRVTFSAWAICCNCRAMVSAGIGRRSKRWHREMMVGRILLGSVVAKMNFTCAGGSSRVFRRALKAAVESMCTSSM